MSLSIRRVGHSYSGVRPGDVFLANFERAPRSAPGPPPGATSRASARVWYALRFVSESPPSTSSDDIALADYRLEERIGEGAMGIVYRAHQKSLDRPVALKILRRELALDRTFVERLEREARAAARFDHPHLVRALAIGEENETHYFAMELVEGTSARAAVEGGPLDEARVREIGRAIADALAYAHERGLVHRDVKPSNILMGDDGTIKLADLGLSKQTIQPDETLSRPGTTLGTPAYMAPEQIRDAASVGTASDVYGLAAALAFLATGELPFRGGTLLEILAAKESGGLSLEGLSPGLVAVLRRGLDPEPAKRPSASELATRLAETDMQPSAAEPEGRRRAMLVAALVSLVVGAALVLVVTDTSRRETDDPAPEPRVASVEVEPNAVDPAPAAPSSPEAALLPNGIAVLPFRNLSADPEYASFADAMHDALIHELARIPSLNVIARSSVWGYDPAEESVAALGRRLRVGNVVEGSVQYVDGRLRVQAALVDPATGRSAWTRRFERPYEDVLQMQGQIATEIARTLQVEILDARSPDPERRLTSPEALMFLAKARATVPNLLPAPLPEFFGFLDAAIEADPDFAYAHGVKSFALALNLGVVRVDGMDLEAQEAAVRHHAEKAMASSGGAAYGNAARALLAEQHRRWEDADRFWRRAVAIDPNEFDILDDYARYMAFRGDFETANSVVRRALDLNPSDKHIESGIAYYEGDLERALATVPPGNPINRALLLTHLGRHAEAVVDLEKLSSKRSLRPPEMAAACYILHRAGRPEEAEAWCRRVDDLTPGAAPAPYLHLARYFTALAREDEAALVEVLSEIEASDQASGPLYFYYVSNIFQDPFADRPAVLEIRRRLGFPG